MKATTYIIILVLLVIIFLQRECNTVNQPLVKTNYIYDTVIDTVVLESNVYVPLPIYHDTGSTILLYQIVDTAAILHDYFSRYFYCDTIQDDSAACIVVCDTVSRNRIVSRQPYVSIYSHLVTRSNIVSQVPAKVRQLSFGAQLNISSTSYGFSPTILYKSKKNTSLSFSYDIINHSYSFGVYLPLNFNRH